MLISSKVPPKNRLAKILLVHAVAMATATVLTSSVRMRWLAGTMESSCTVKSSFTSGISSGRMVNCISAVLEPGEEGRRGMEGEEGGEEVRWSEKIEGGRKRRRRIKTGRGGGEGGDGEKGRQKGRKKGVREEGEKNQGRGVRKGRGKQKGRDGRKSVIIWVHCQTILPYYPIRS